MEKLENLMLIRKERKLSRKDLSKLSGVDYHTIQALEMGVTNVNEAKLSTLIKLASALRVRVRKLVDIETSKKL